PAIGAPVFALGNPGTGLRITEGQVSAAPLTIRSRDGRPLEVIEHTAPMPRGSGGGPLLDEHGAVLGLNALRGAPGFLLALPAAEPGVCGARGGGGRGGGRRPGGRGPGGGRVWGGRPPRPERAAGCAAPWASPSATGCSSAPSRREAPPKAPESWLAICWSAS